LSDDNRVEGRAKIVDRSTDCAVHGQKTNAAVSESLLLPLLECHPALIANTRLKHLLKQRSEQEFGLVKPTLKPGVQQLKALPACGDVLKLRIDRFLAVVSW
jgi:hypothetical protein